MLVAFDWRPSVSASTWDCWLLSSFSRGCRSRRVVMLIFGNLFILFSLLCWHPLMTPGPQLIGLQGSIYGLLLLLFSVGWRELGLTLACGYTIGG